MSEAEVTQSFFKKLAVIRSSFFSGYSLAKRSEKANKQIDVFFRFPPVLQKEFSEMHGVKQTQMKFIIVKFAFKKATFSR